MCVVNHVRKGKQVEHAANLKLDEATLVEKLKTGTKYKFLSVRESVMEDEKLALTGAAKTYLQRLSINWTSLMSCLLYTSPSPRDLSTSRMPSSA